MLKKTCSVENFLNDLNRIKVTDCNLLHEKVEIKTDGSMRKRQIGDQHEFVRPGLCSSTKRDNLGCAHTTARNELIRKVSNFAQSNRSYELICQQFVQALKQQEMNIINIDLAKSEAELNWARAYEMQSAQGKMLMTQAQNEINQQINAHQQQNQHLRTILKQLIDSISAPLKSKEQPEQAIITHGK